MSGKMVAVLGFVVCLGLLFACAGNVSAQAAGKVNVNQATAQQLGNVPGINADMAKAIVDYRTKSGALKGPEDLAKVPGMTKETTDALAPNLAFGPAKKAQGDDEEAKLPRY